MIVYIVYGNTGEYEDFDTWLAKAFKYEAKAEDFRLKCQEYADYMMEDVKHTDGNIYPRYYVEDYNSPDERFHIDYTGTWYAIEKIEVEE